MTRPSIAWPLAAILAAVLLAHSCRDRAGAGTVRQVTTVDTVYRDMPVERTRFMDRILWKSVPAETVQVTTPGAVVHLVDRFCGANNSAELVADSSTRPAIQPQLVLTAGRVEGQKLTLFGFTNTGEAYRGTWAVRPRYEFSTRDTSVSVNEKRMIRLPWWVRDGAIAAGGYFLGRRLN